MSCVAWIGWTDAVTPRYPKRAMSLGASSCACSMRRGSPGASCCARARMSSTSRFARSPIAWMAGASPCSRQRLTPRSNSSMGCSARPVSLAPSQGSSIQAVIDPSAPSAKNFTPPMRSISSPSPVARLRSIHSSSMPADMNGRTRKRSLPESLSACSACSSPRPTSIAWTPVTPRLCAWAIAISVAAMRSVCVRRGAASVMMREALSRRMPVGSPASSTSIAPPAGTGVADVTPAARSAALFTQMQWPEVCVSTIGWSGAAASRSRRSGKRAPGTAC